MTADRARSGPLLLIVTSLGIVIAWAIPRSVAIPAAAPARVAVVVVALVVGTGLSWRLDLDLRAHGARRPVLRGGIIGLAFGIYMALADGLVFRHQIPPSQIDIIATVPAWERIVVSMPIVLVDELVYRLGMVPLLAWLFAGGGRKAEGAPRDRVFWLAIVGAATVYILLHLGVVTGGREPTLGLAARELALHVSAGSLWGYLFWRNGLPTAIAAHMSAHVTLQIGLGLLLT